MQVVGVLLPLPFSEAFDYYADESIRAGVLVRVPFGHKMVVGVVWETDKKSALDSKKIKKIVEVLPYPPLKNEMRQFIDFVASYNMAFRGLVLKMALSVKQVFDDPKILKFYELSGKTPSSLRFLRKYLYSNRYNSSRLNFAKTSPICSRNTVKQSRIYR